MPFKLNTILRHKEKDVAAAKKLRSIGDLKRMIRDAPPVRSFKQALAGGFGLIAEIKRKSPSGGEMLEANFVDAPGVYASSPVVKAVSILTNSNFGMKVEDLRTYRSLVNKPILRKDFLTTEYEIYEARAFGADAVLLMANVLKQDEMQRLFERACELELDVLFESHTKAEIETIPNGASIYGINSRKFMAVNRWHVANVVNKFARFGFWRPDTSPDVTVELSTFTIVKHLPKHAIKVAESGIKPSKVQEIMGMGFDSMLVGTSLLKSPQGIQAALSEFEQEIIPSRRKVSTLSETAHA
ncbi:MAG: indole-3-glycerol-phosphate synthase [Pedosphaera sp.]|nr:indole-3-glycerol-phosphate synthase [Pedosphaera sp.]